MARSNQGRSAEADKAPTPRWRYAGRRRPVRRRQRLNMLIFNQADFSVQLKLLHQALADFEAAGYVERQAIITANMGIAYSRLGLYRRARRLFLSANEIIVGPVRACPRPIISLRSPRSSSQWAFRKCGRVYRRNDRMTEALATPQSAAASP
jgi:tetratricopeptide (TPR) repeat protein